MQLRLIHYFEIFLCLIRNDHIVRRLNFVLIFLLLLLIFSLYKCYVLIRFSIVLRFNCYYIIKSHFSLFITFPPYYLFWFKLINKLYGVDYFSSEIGSTTECEGKFCCNATEIWLWYQADHLHDHHFEKVEEKYQHIVALLASPSLKYLVKKIQPLFVHMCCINSCYILPRVYFHILY